MELKEEQRRLEKGNQVFGASGSVVRCKEEAPDEVEIKVEPLEIPLVPASVSTKEEILDSSLHQYQYPIVKEEITERINRADEDYCVASSAERSASQIHSEDKAQLHGSPRTEEGAFKSPLCYEEKVNVKAEPIECPVISVTVKTEEEEQELHAPLFNPTIKEEIREDAGGAGAGSEKCPKGEEQHGNPSDTDDSEDWAPAAEKPTPQTQKTKVKKEEVEMKIYARTKKRKKDLSKLAPAAERTSSEKQLKRFKCTICDKSFAHKYGINRHMKTHTGERAFQCVICTKRFIQASHLYQHMITHTDRKPHKCPFCEKGFMLQQQLDLHVKLHVGEKPFKCKVCERGYIEKSSLTRHMIIHTGERPFKCTHCEKAYTRKHNLEDHMRLHT